jgi:hypothetical protein
MRILGLVAIVLTLLSGCSGKPGALHPPSVNPAKASHAAVHDFDRNGDGTLSKEEWSASPELSAVAAQYDSNHDGTLDVDEIRGGIEIWQENAVGPRQMPFTVKLDGRPLTGATVKLVPASFFGPEMKGASCESGAGGGGMLAMAREDMPKNAPEMALVQPGLYRVEISHPTLKVPTRYNTETTLGIEVTSGNPGPQGVHWSLNTR